MSWIQTLALEISSAGEAGVSVPVVQPQFRVALGTDAWSTLSTQERQ